MSGRSLVGLLALNVFALGVGTGLLWGLRGWRTWLELARLSGLAYMVGIVGLGVALTLELVVGVPFSIASILLTGVALSAGGVLAGRALRRPRPVLGGPLVRPSWLMTAALIAAVVVYLEAVFRAGRLPGLYAWDAWSFWVPKAKAIYFFGGLDQQFFSELPNPTYPPLVPALEATAFTFMGSPDVVTLHLQFWFFLVGFVGAAAGLLVSRVRPMFVWTFLLLVLVSPRVVGRTLEPQADFLLDYQFALAALLVALWLVERSPWLLATASVFLAGILLTKREGQLLALCIVVAAVAASVRDWRTAWPRIALASGIAVAAALPWRIWYVAHDLAGEFPDSGGTGLLDTTERAWPALRSVLSAAFEADLWTIVMPLTIAAIVLAFLAGARTLPIYATFVYGSALVGFTWALWAFTELELPIEQDEAVNPVVRLTGALVIATVALGPLLLDAAWRGADTSEKAG